MPKQYEGLCGLRRAAHGIEASVMVIAEALDVVNPALYFAHDPGQVFVGVDDRIAVQVLCPATGLKPQLYTPRRQPLAFDP